MPLFFLVLCSTLYNVALEFSFLAQTNSVCAKILHTLTPTIYVKDENRRTSFAYQSYVGIRVSFLKSHVTIQICVNSCEFYKEQF